MKLEIIDCTEIMKRTAELNLSDELEQRQTVCVAEYRITFKDKMFFGLLKRLPKGKLPLTIKSTCKLGSAVKLDPTCDLLTLECKEKSGHKIDIDIENESEVKLKVIFCPAAILDCDRTDENGHAITEFSIDYTIKCNLEKSKTKNGTANIKLRPIDVAPVLGPLDQNDKPCPRFTFDYRQDRVEAKLRASNSSILHYAPSACMKITSVKLFDPSGDKIIQDAVEIDYSKAKPSKSYSPTNVKIVGINQQVLVNSKNEIEAIHPEKGYFIKLPFSIDLSRIPNPQQPQDTYRLAIEYEYWDVTDSRRRVATKNCDVVINKNQERIELGVSLQAKHQDEFKTLSVVSENTRADQTIMANEGDDTTYRIAIENTATVTQTGHESAGIVIKNFNCTGITFRNGINAKDSLNKTIDIHSFCKCNPLSINEKVLLPQCTHQSSINIDIPFNMETAIDHFSSSGDSKTFKAEAEVRISFDYCIDSIGNRQYSTPFEHFEGAVAFTLEIPPQPKWLGIDFGSSAVVALYGNTVDLGTGLHQNCIQSLKDTKKTGLAIAYPNHASSFRSVTDEDVFINSKIVLGDRFPDGVDTVKEFREYPRGKILFSPGDGFNYQKLLPSLKSMMGYDRIPLVMAGMSNPPSVDKIYEMAYQQLFNLYLKSISKQQPIEKIVMTYPNTFATRHVARLKQLAKECLPTLRDDYIVTVSESDAVAFRYLMIREKLGFPKDSDADRNVFIYDMGAGTLDITYFSNIKEGDVRKVDIKGKFGISKAGNYLDYILAEIVVDICNKQGFKDANGKSFDGYLSIDSKRAGDISTFSKLKNYVKDRLKPLLASPNDNAMMPKWDSISGEALEAIPLSVVYKHQKFIAFINDISKGVIEGCNSIFPGGLQDADVIVFSGRMCSMQAIRDAVLDAVNKIVKKKNSKNVVIPKDIAQCETDGKAKLQVRKTAVVEGALNYVECIGKANQDGQQQGDFVLLPSKPFFAHYCVIVHKLPENYRVIDHVDNSMEAENYSASKNIDLTSVYALYLIQTYAVGDEAIIKDFVGDRNLTTVLEARDTTNLKDTYSVAVKIDCQDEGNRYEQGAKSISLWIGASHKSTLPHENIKSEAFRKSAWPIVFE